MQGVGDIARVPHFDAAREIVGYSLRNALRIDVVFGASKRDDGHWVLPELKSELASPDAALHIGPQHVVLESAAVDLAAELAHTRKLQVQSWHVMFMARGKVGPFRVAGTAHHGTSGRTGVRMLIHDEGNEDRLITTCSAVFDALP